MSVLVFDVTPEADGGYVAVAVGENIVTQADTWEEPRVNVLEAVGVHFLETTKPSYVRLYLNHQERIALRN